MKLTNFRASNRKQFWIWAGLFTWMLLCIHGMIAQNIPQVKTNVRVSHSAVPAGGDFFILGEYQIPSGTHLTENFLELNLESPKDFSSGLLQISSGEFQGGEVVRHGKVYMKLPVSIPDATAPGTYELTGKMVYQVCTEGAQFMCFPPADKPFQVKLKVLPANEAAIQNSDVIQKSREIFPDSSGSSSVSGAGEKKSLDNRLKNALSQGSVLAFILVFLGGFLTSLTPCVYPMIPITISYIGARSAGAGKSRGFILSLFFVLGLALVYSALGLMAALTGSLFGSITQTPAVVGFVVLVFIIMGISMMGVFDITLPSGIAGKLQSGGPRKGFGGAIVMGMISGLVAAPCAGPVVIVLLAYIASTHSIIFGFSLMMFFAFGMGILFIAIGTFSGLLTTLPQAGAWMDKVKKIFGIILIGAGIYIANPLLPPPVFGLTVGIALLLLGAGIGGLDHIEHVVSTSVKLKKGIGLLFIAAGIYIVLMLLPVPGRVIPEQQAVTSPATTGSVWRSDLSNALKDARIQKKMVVMDFGAKWCAACRELEHKTFSDPEIETLLKDMILVRIDCTKSRDADVVKIQKKYGVKGLPTVILLGSDGFELARFTSFLPPDEFKRFISNSIGDGSTDNSSEEN